MKDIKASFKMAIKDTVDVSIILIVILLSGLDLWGVDVRGSTGFVTFYAIFAIMRLDYYKTKVKFDNDIKLNK